jgi:predicted RNase H-like HicB family nuclease
MSLGNLSASGGNPVFPSWSILPDSSPFPQMFELPFRDSFYTLRNKKRSAEMIQKQFTAIIDREDDGFSALCPELDIASQGDTIEEAKKNLQEALELFFECASPEEIEIRLHKETDITQIGVAVG